MSVYSLRGGFSVSQSECTGIMAGIYGIFGPAGRVYIGQSQNILMRLKEHLKALKAARHKNKKLQSAWNKYGHAKFFLVPLEAVIGGKADLAKREQFWMDALQSCKNGYNLAPSSMSMAGFKHSDESRKKISEAVRARPGPSQETKDKIGAAHRGMKRHATVGENISKALIGRKLAAYHVKKLSETHREEVSGNRYGMLTAVEFLEVDRGRSIWRFECDCGVSIANYLYNVKVSPKASCGCATTSLHVAKAVGNKYRRLDMTGMKFGSLTVNETFVPEGKDQTWVTCTCVCGNKITTRSLMMRGKQAIKATKRETCCCSSNRLKGLK